MRVRKRGLSVTADDLIIQEQHHRYKLDELINFFTLLTGRDNVREIILRCDFSYSWWRPLFGMIASRQERRINEYPRVRAYATHLYF